jgi:hypothetical protein
MPELWLNYGSTDVIVDLRVENLSIIENSKFDIRNEERLDQEIESIPITENTILVPLDASNSTVQLTSRLVSLAEVGGLRYLLKQFLKRAGYCQTKYKAKI